MSSANHSFSSSYSVHEYGEASCSIRCADDDVVTIPNVNNLIDSISIYKIDVAFIDNALYYPSYGSANQYGVILNNGKRCVAGYEDGSVRVFDLKTGQVCSNT